MRLGNRAVAAAIVVLCGSVSWGWPGRSRTLPQSRSLGWHASADVDVQYEQGRPTRVIHGVTRWKFEPRRLFGLRSPWVRRDRVETVTELGPQRQPVRTVTSYTDASGHTAVQDVHPHAQQWQPASGSWIDSSGRVGAISPRSVKQMEPDFRIFHTVYRVGADPVGAAGIITYSVHPPDARRRGRDRSMNFHTEFNEGEPPTTSIQQRGADRSHYPHVVR
jgi:hypothetical protein